MTNEMSKLKAEIERRRDLWAECLRQSRAIGNETYNNRMCAKLVELNELLEFIERGRRETEIERLRRLGLADA